MVDWSLANNQINCYRIDQCYNNINYILSNCSITKTIIDLANQLSNKNSYHNFWHQVSVAKAALMIWISEGCNINELNYLALVWLFHDAWHTWKALPEDEENAFQLTVNNISNEQLIQYWVTKEKLHIWIISTTYKERWKHKWKLEKIIQDADMEGIGFWVNYMLYSNLQYLWEVNLWSEKFKINQREFIKELQSINKDIFLSEWAKRIYISPVESLKKLDEIDDIIIQKAFSLTKTNITFDNFCQELNLTK